MKLMTNEVLVATRATAGIGQEPQAVRRARRQHRHYRAPTPKDGAQTVAVTRQKVAVAVIAADLNDIRSVRRLAEQSRYVDVLVNDAATGHGRSDVGAGRRVVDMMSTSTCAHPSFDRGAAAKMIAAGRARS